ncbi:hypothetical protein I4U23_011424 [Adineta vaga]|nr:hypothetical protein I4U23_011424 [Adineta vaga]
MSQTKLEILPNEILLQCFHYFQIIDIFHSFDQLNHRFNSLIRNISFPFSLNFQNIHNRFQCEEICRTLSINQTWKNQLYSLHLSNENTCYPIHLFISKFSLLQFPHLRSLTLSKITEKNWKSIGTELSSIPELSCFRIFQCDISGKSIIPMLPISKLQTLIIPFPSFPKVTPDIQLSSLIHLSIFGCHLHELFIILNNASKLNYIELRNVPPPKWGLFWSMTDDAHNSTPANNLKTLHIHWFQGNIDALFMLLERTPNLENFIILSNSDPNMIQADKWQNFIISSLPHLRNFKFRFVVIDFVRNSIHERRLKEFQNNFWFNQHHLYIEYAIWPSRAEIYTLPYPFNTFEFSLDCHIYYNEIIDRINTFDNVKDLSVDFEKLTENNPHYFSKIESLSFGCQDRIKGKYITMNYSHLKYIQTTMNLSNIKHLTLLDGLQFESSDIFKEILKSAIQLTSLRVNFSHLIKWFHNNELCKYFTKRIRKLYIHSGLFENSDQLEQFCAIFVNLEQLGCFFNQSVILFLIKNLHKLICIENYGCLKNYEISSIEKEIEKLGLDIIIDLDDYENLDFIYLNRSKLNRNIS